MIFSCKCKFIYFFTHRLCIFKRPSTIYLTFITSVVYFDSFIHPTHKCTKHTHSIWPTRYVMQHSPWVNGTRVSKSYLLHAFSTLSPCWQLSVCITISLEQVNQRTAWQTMHTFEIFIRRVTVRCLRQPWKVPKSNLTLSKYHNNHFRGDAEWIPSLDVLACLFILAAFDQSLRAELEVLLSANRPGELWYGIRGGTSPY